MAKILIVDDSAELLEVLSFLIHRHGDEAITISYAEYLLETVQKHKPDVIILDVMLRGIDGRELCREIKSTKAIKDIPVILMSASNTLLDGYEECNADAILEKPFDLTIIYEKINAVLGKSG